MAAPGPSMASTSPMKYHVFLSFKGNDTRTNFPDHLYFSLLRQRIVTLRDDEDLHRGEVISDKLVQAIEQSMSAIVKIVESKNDSSRTIFPVFYGIYPIDVQCQKRKFSTAFEKHEVRFPDDKVQRWREALMKIANLSGWGTRDK
ncbi:toll/interleukin-1 receptor-like protein [Prosopis cineraria]|uniref:toll/interleukin-1 receptor-like protein n=1 Tax=Prosopis cineraria TaxID=364024 RepID=UPI00240F09E4|nr:toll/interleukin-1 receptor-like protein [Prosopis cineraria]